MCVVGVEAAKSETRDTRLRQNCNWLAKLSHSKVLSSYTTTKLWNETGYFVKENKIPVINQNQIISFKKEGFEKNLIIRQTIFYIFWLFVLPDSDSDSVDWRVALEAKLDLMNG